MQANKAQGNSATRHSPAFFSLQSLQSLRSLQSLLVRAFIPIELHLRSLLRRRRRLELFLTLRPNDLGGERLRKAAHVGVVARDGLVEIAARN